MQPDFSRDARIAPILTRIAQLPKKPRLLVTIDGPCGSGKSTLAVVYRCTRKSSYAKLPK